MAPSKDLFDDSVMTFGEHLEVLRKHLIQAIIGLVIACCITLYYGEAIVRFIREPISAALQRAQARVKQNEGRKEPPGFWEGMYRQWVPISTPEDPELTERTPEEQERFLRTVTLSIPADQLVAQLHELAPSTYALPKEDLTGKMLTLTSQSEEMLAIRKSVKRLDDPVTLNVQEAFLTYFKVSLISGLVLASPWVIYQLWLFVAAGLYPHERKYVYRYLPMSIILFLGGIFFCYFAVFPTVLDFLLDYNVRIGLTAQIRISEWISFAVTMPLMFGVSFQLPLVMLFLQRIGIFPLEAYREQRRMAILVIAIVSMLLTPSDPFSMLLMMFPLLALYELGVWLCSLKTDAEPTEIQPV
jgi:sec-independent protein translocase protein TatC